MRHAVMLTSEEKELLRIERERKQLQNRLRSSRRRSERAVDGSFGRMPARSTKPLTEPKEFILRTSERSRPMQVQMEYDEEGVSECGTSRYCLCGCVRSLHLTMRTFSFLYCDSVLSLALSRGIGLKD